MPRHFNYSRHFVAIVLCVLLVLSALLGFAGCSDSPPQSVGRPDLRFALTETGNIIFIGSNIVSVSAEYEEGNEPWEVQMFDGDTWHSVKAGQPPNRWYVKIVLDKQGANALSAISASHIGERAAMTVESEKFGSYSIGFIISQHFGNGAFEFSRGSSEENARGLVAYLLGDLTTTEYTSKFPT